MEERALVEQERPITHHEIHIEGIVSGSDLELSDGGRTEAWSGDTITWIIDDDSGIESIIAIIPKSGNPNVFSHGPWKDGAKKCKGKVKVGKPTEEHYTIIFKKTGDKEVYFFDPIIQANP